MSLPEVYRQIHDATDYNLLQIQGLLLAMDSVIDDHADLRGNDPETQALRSLVEALHRRVQGAMADQEAARQAMAAPEPPETPKA